jgi:hypothetical protein
LTQVDQEIDKVDCVTNDVVQTGDDLAKYLWGHFIISAAIGLTESCNWKEHYIWTVSGDEHPAYEAALCIIKRDLDNSTTVGKIVYNYNRLAGMAHLYACKFRGTPGEGDAKRDLANFTKAHDIWVLTLGESASK